MNSWLFFSAVAPVLWGLSNAGDAIVRRSFVKSDLANTWFLSVSRLPILAGLLLYAGFEIPSATAVAMMIIAGLFWMAPFILYYKAIEFEEPSRVALLIQSTPVFILIVSFFLIGERLTPIELGAFALLIFGGVVASFRHAEGRLHLSRALPIVFLACLLWAFSDVFFKKYEAAFSNFYAGFAIYFVGSFLFAILMLFTKKTRQHIAVNFRGLPARAWTIIAINQIVGLTGSVAFAYALTLGKASLTSAFIASQPLFAFAFGFLLKRFLPEAQPEELGGKSLLTKSAALMFIAGGIIILQFYG